MAMLLLALAVSAYADEMATQQLPTGTIRSNGVTVYDRPDSGAAVVGTLSGGSAVIILNTQGNMIQVFARADRMTGWVDSASVARENNLVYPGIVISQSVSLRETRSTASKRLANIPNGTMLDLLEEQDGWYYVRFWDGKSQTPLEGWVRTDFVVRNPQFLTTYQSTYVYAAPSRSMKKVGQLVAGTQLVIIGEYNDFWIVNLRSASGFIHKNDI